MASGKNNRGHHAARASFDSRGPEKDGGRDAAGGTHRPVIEAQDAARGSPPRFSRFLLAGLVRSPDDSRTLLLPVIGST